MRNELVIWGFEKDWEKSIEICDVFITVTVYVLKFSYVFWSSYILLNDYIMFMDREKNLVGECKSVCEMVFR